MPKVTFLPHKQDIQVDEGEILIRAALEAGVHVNASCGGEGLCGKCRVLIEEGRVEDGTSEKLSRQDVENGYRLACRSHVVEDLVVRIPIESEVDAAVLNMQATPRCTARIQEMNLEELKDKGLFMPPVEKQYLELPPPTVQDNLADATRLVSFLKLKHNEHRLVVELPVIRKLPDALRQDDFRITATLARPVHEGRKTRIIDVQPGDTANRNYAIAVDIGTTTIYAQLIDLISGEVLAQFGEFNGQISYGEDVISRIVYAEKPGGLERLHSVVLQTINSVIRKIIRRAGYRDWRGFRYNPGRQHHHDPTLFGGESPLHSAIALRSGIHILSADRRRGIRLGVGRPRFRAGISIRFQLRGRRHRCRCDGIGRIPH